MSIAERTNVTITRIISPTKFWLRLQTDDYISGRNASQVYSGIAEKDSNEAGDNNLSWVKGNFQKCFLLIALV